MKKGWTYKKLGEVVTFARGLTYSKNDEVEHSNNIVLRSNNIDLIAGKLDFSELKFLKENFVIPNDKRLRKGSLFICMSNGSKAHLGKVAYVDKDYGYAFGGFMGQISPNEEIDGLYLHYALSSPFYKDYIKSLAEGANINNLKFKDLSEFNIKYPSLPEQRSIVARLDAAFANIDALKANAEKQLSEARQLFQAELTECMRPKEGWEEKMFTEVCDVITDFVAAGSFADLRKNVEYIDSPDYAQLVRTTDLKHDFGNKSFVYVTEHAFNYLWRVNLNEESIILPNVGVNCGEVYYVNPHALPYKNNVLGPNAIMVRSHTYDNRFLSYLFLGEAIQLQLKHITSSMAQPKYNKTNLKKLVVSIPSVEVQHQIVSHLDALSARVKQLEEVQRKTMEECDALKQAMLREVFE